MNLAEVAAVEVTTRFFAFDIFMVLFTLIIAYGMYRLIKAPQKNILALGFGGVCLLVFLVADVLMVMNWMGILVGQG
jgi:hypothetical protein